MRKIIIVSLVLLFFTSLCLAQHSDETTEQILFEKKAELAKVSKYINTLDKKIKAAKKTDNISKENQLKNMKTDALIRAKSIKKEIDKIENPEPIAQPMVREEVVIREVVVERGKSTQIGGNIMYGGGAGGVGVDFIRPVNDVVNFRIGIGYLQGNQYSVMTTGLAIMRVFVDKYVGLGLDYASYSTTIADIPGLSGNVTQGGHTGAGLFAGISLDDTKNLEVGYSSALGFTGRAVYKF